MSAPLQVVYITGSGRSGTTLLGHILGQLEGFCFVGEAMYAWRALGQRLCGCGVPLESCEFWSAVRREAGGERPVEPEDFFGLGRLARWRHLPTTLLPGRQRRITARFGHAARVCERLYRAAAATAGASVIVDSSKAIPYLYLLGLGADLDLRVVHLVRDARGVAHSWDRAKPAPDRVGVQYMRTRGLGLSVFFWSVSNVGAELFGGPRARYLRVRYEDFARRPRATIERILDMAMAPQSAGPAAAGARRPALPFVGEHAVKLRATHSIKGNPDRLQTGALDIRLDDRWSTEMAPRARRVVTALAWPLLARYGYLGAIPRG